MKISLEKDNLMILNNTPYSRLFLGILFFGIGILMALKPNISTTPIPIWFAILFIIAGIAICIFTNYRKVIIDKTIGKIIISNRTLFNKKNADYLISDVQGIRLCSRTYSQHTKRGNQTKTEHWLELIKKTGSIQLSEPSSSNLSIMGVSIEGKETLGSKIAAFIKVPYDEERPPTINETITAIKDAVKESIDSNEEKL